MRCEQVSGTKVQRLVYLLGLDERQETEAEPKGEEMAEFSEPAARRGWEGSDRPTSAALIPLSGPQPLRG